MPLQLFFFNCQCLSSSSYPWGRGDCLNSYALWFTNSSRSSPHCRCEMRHRLLVTEIPWPWVQCPFFPPYLLAQGQRASLTRSAQFKHCLVLSPLMRHLQLAWTVYLCWQRVETSIGPSHTQSWLCVVSKERLFTLCSVTRANIETNSEHA